MKISKSALDKILSLFVPVNRAQILYKTMKKPTVMLLFTWSCYERAVIGYEDKIIGGVDFLAIHERAFYGPLWTKLLGKGLFHGVHQHLYGIVAEQAFIPRCLTHPKSLADYLSSAA